SSFCFTHTSTSEIYTLSLHDALPIFGLWVRRFLGARVGHLASGDDCRSYGRQTGRAASHDVDRCCVYAAQRNAGTAHWFLAGAPDRKSTRLNSSHRTISYAVFCLKKK